MVPRIGPIKPLPLLVDHLGPIRDTAKSTIAATGISNETRFKEARILELEKVPWAPPRKIGEQSL